MFLVKLFNYKKILFNNVNSFFMGKCLRNKGNLKVYGRVVIENPKNLYLGRNVTINEGVYINCRANVYIGDNVRISAGCKILTTGLDGNRLHTCSDITIAKDCWLGANSIILPGVIIADNSVVAAGAIVTKSFHDINSKIVGIPAKKSNK